MMGTTTSNADGVFSKQFPAQQNGIRNIKVYATTPQSERTDTVNINVDVVEHNTTTVEVFLPTVIKLSSASLTRGSDLVVSGITIPQGRVILTLDDRSDFQTLTGTDGRWQIHLPTTDLSAGEHSLVAMVKDSTGKQSSPTQRRHFNVLISDEETLGTGGTTPAPMSDQEQTPIYPDFGLPADWTTKLVGNLAFPYILLLAYLLSLFPYSWWYLLLGGLTALFVASWRWWHRHHESLAHPLFIIAAKRRRKNKQR